MRVRRLSLAIAMTLLTGAPATPLAAADEGGTQLLGGARLRLATSRAGVRLVASSADPSLALGEGPGSEDDPTLHGGSLRAVSVRGFFDAAAELPASGWRRTREGFAFDGGAGSLRVQLRAGRGLRLHGTLASLAHLPAADPGAIALELRTGARRYCLLFGGDAKGTPGEKLVVADAPAPEACIGLAGSSFVLGGVVAAIPSAAPLPDASVWIEVDGVSVAETKSDEDGRFRARLTLVLPWAGRVCASREGFEAACLDASLPRPEGERRLELALAPLGPLLVGRVVLADGTPCFEAASLLDPGRRGGVSLLASPPLEALADRGGRFVLPGAPTGSVPVLARCGTAEVESVLTVAPEDLDGGRVFDLVIPNHPPVIDALVARDAGGNAVRHAEPGETLSVTARASDPDGDALAIRWYDDGRGEVLGTGETLEWPLPEAGALSLLRVFVSDGRGGEAQDVLLLRTGEPLDRVLGRVVDASGEPVAGAEVRVDAASAVVSDTSGSFRTAVAPRDRHVLEARAAGHGEATKLVHGGALADVLLVLPAAALAEIDPDAPTSSVADPATGALVSLSGGTLVDAAGAPAAGPVTLSFHPYALDEADPPPGDGLARPGPGEGPAPGVRLVAAAAIHARDSIGRALRLAPGARVLVELPQPARAIPSGLVVVAFDPHEGLWVDTSHAILPSDDKLVFTTDVLGVVGPAVKLPETACRRIRADVGSLTLPLEAFVYRHTGFDGEGKPRYEEFHASFTLSDYETTYPVPALEPGAFYFLSLNPTTGDRNGSVLPQPLTDRFLAPAAPALGFPVGPDYEACLPYFAYGPKRFALTPFTKGDAGPPPTPPAEPAKATYPGWLAANGFSFASAVASARFYNRAELGLGRDVLCFRSGKRLACAIRKYGAPGGDVASALDDMIQQSSPGEIVTIDTDAPGAPVRFYNYTPDGKRKLEASFGGKPKAMPGACWGCHQEGFVPIDPNTHVYPASAPRSAQAESVRRLNALLHEYLGPVSRAFLAKLYPEGLFTPGSAAAELVPADYAAAGMGSTYTKVVRDHCQLCHLRVAEADPSLDWTRLVNLRNGGPAYAIYCFPKYLAPIPIVPGDMVMPWAWVPRRNLLQHPMTHELIRQADVYASAPPPGGYRCVAPLPILHDKVPSP